MFIKKYFVVALTFLLLSSCNSTKAVVSETKPIKHKPTPKKIPAVVVKNTKNNKPKDTLPETEVIVSTSKTKVTNQVIFSYVDQYKEIAMSNMRTFGIPASIILAQAILESGSGYGKLAVTANNHFGIKCHKGWTGETVHHDDDASQECFRKYTLAEESFKDHAQFLTTRGRYEKLFKLEKGDYKGWAYGLKAAGYATDPRYPEKLISYIDKYKLHQYDNQVLGIVEQEKTAEVAQTELPIDESKYYEIQKGDTLYSISKKFNLTVDDLKSLNNMSDNTLSVGQKIRIVK